MRFYLTHFRLVIEVASVHQPRVRITNTRVPINEGMLSCSEYHCLFCPMP